MRTKTLPSAHPAGGEARQAEPRAQLAGAAPPLQQLRARRQVVGEQPGGRPQDLPRQVVVGCTGRHAGQRSGSGRAAEGSIPHA